MKQYTLLEHSAYVDAITLVGSQRDWLYCGELDFFNFALTIYNGGSEWKKDLWSQYGYRGWRVGSLSYGVSASGMVRVSATGHVAHVVCIRFAGFDLRCSRIDLQVTARYGQEPTDVIRRSFVESSGYHSTNPRVHPRASMIDGAGYGDTCYIGRRGGERFVRIYDKGLQSGKDEYANCVRFECELSGSEATCAWRDGSDAQFGSVWIAGRVADCVRWGGCFALRSVKSFFPSERVVRSDDSDAKRKLAWLRTQVRPSVEWLLTAVPESDILSALGLSNECEVARISEVGV